MTILNPRLVVQQELTDADCDELERLHDQRERIFETMYDLDPTIPADKELLILLGDLITSLEYNMQRVWKFPQTQSMHSWWYRVPHCSCPVLDNNDMQGADVNLYRLNCPIHGHMFKQEIGETYEDDDICRFISYNR